MDVRQFGALSGEPGLGACGRADAREPDDVDHRRLPRRAVLRRVSPHAAVRTHCRGLTDAARDSLADIPSRGIRVRGAHLMAERTARRAETRPADVRIASRPGPEDQNPYFRLMYNALDRIGIRHAGAFQVNDDWLRANATEFDALHLHWPEWLWRPGGRSSLRWIG